MSATFVVVRDQAEWDRIIDLLGQLEQGGIIISPEACERLDSEAPEWEQRLLDEEGKYLEYDFGGEPEVVIDVARRDNYATSELLSKLGVE